MRPLVALLILALTLPAVSNAQEPADFITVNLPTTLRLPRYKSAFRISHRFTRTLNAPSFDDLASNLFGLDGGAFIGLEYRFGVC